MIPKGIRREHVLRALAYIDGHGVEPRRGATRHDLWHAGRAYPPKHVVSLACRFATDEELPPPAFSGGAETNASLRELGFEVRARATRQAPVVQENRGEGNALLRRGNG